MIQWPHSSRRSTPNRLPPRRKLSRLVFQYERAGAGREHSHQPGHLSATVVEAGGTVRRLPVSEWAKPEELARQIAAEGLPMPQLPHQMGLLQAGSPER